MNPLYGLVFSACLLSGIAAFGQAPVPDSTVSTDPAAYYHKLIGKSSGLYSGIEYKAPSPLIVGLRYFLNGDWNKGTVTYKQVLYENVLIRYDAFDDNLVALLFNQALPYVLNSEQVQSFNIANHHFVFVAADTLQKEHTVKPGFYEQLYQGKTKVLVKHSKTIETSSTSSQLESRYVDKVNVYLRNRNNYYPVSNNSSVVSALQDRKKEIQQYIKTNRIRVKKNAPEGLVQIAAYYDTLTQ